MLKYFSKKNNLTEVIDFMNGETPRLVICEYNCLMDNRMIERDDDEEDLKKKINSFITDDKTISFSIFDNKFSYDEIKVGLTTGDFFDIIDSQEDLLAPMLENYLNVLDGINNIWSVSLDDYKKNNLLSAILSEQSFDDLKIYLLFSTLIDAYAFILLHEIPKNVIIIVFDLSSKYNEIVFKKLTSSGIIQY